MACGFSTNRVTTMVDVPLTATGDTAADDNGDAQAADVNTEEGRGTTDTLHGYQFRAKAGASIGKPPIGEFVAILHTLRIAKNMSGYDRGVTEQCNASSARMDLGDYTDVRD